MMQRIFLVCAALAFGILASPITAQQTQPDQSTQPAQPAPEQQTAPEPPPFPPMPKARPAHRFVDVGEARARHARHRAARVEHRRTHERQRVAAPSRKTVRKCHGMSYRQIMRSSECRVLMKQELDATERHARHPHKASRRHHHRRT